MMKKGRENITVQTECMKSGNIDFKNKLSI